MKVRGMRPGVVVREERIGADEYTTADGICVSTPVRTALDLARHLPGIRAMTHLDALATVTGIEPAAVLALARRYPGARGVRRARAILPLIDAGAQSPRESWLRMVLVDAGLHVEQGLQFFAVASIAARCSVMACTIAVATGCT
jgi:hypothetical protein